MYQDKIRLLNGSGECAPPTTQKTRASQSKTILVRAPRVVSTLPRKRRRAANVALAERLRDDAGLSTSLDLADDGFTYAYEPTGVPPRASLFEQDLPIGINYAIPSGTGYSRPETDRVGDISHPLLDAYDAIDAGLTNLGRVSPQVAFFLRNSRAPNTRRTYRWAWERTLGVCERMDRCPLPMSEATAAMVMVDAVNDGLVLGSIKVIASVISVAHQLAEQLDPTATAAFRSVMRGIGRLIGSRQDAKVALDSDELRLIRESCAKDPNTARGTRDWAMISFGFSGCFRRSELVSRTHADLEWGDDEVRVFLDRSKTDQVARGAYITIRAAKDPIVCPLGALRDWIAIAPGPGALFRPISKHSTVLARQLGVTAVTQIVKGFGIVLDLPEDRLGAHSLRAGMITALIDSGLSDAQTMEHSRHRSPQTLRKYYRPRRSIVNYTVLAGL